jgi:caffeoyl-CoA O-methyltransferase
MPRTLLPQSVDLYLDAHSPESAVAEELRAVTAPMEWSMMQIAPSQARFLGWVVKMLGAKRTIEVGVFTGMSSLVTALALPKDGYLLACDVSEDWTKIARDHWKKAGVDHKVELVLAPALETLQARIRQGESKSYDFAFIDADKSGYRDYFEACVRLVRPGGVIMFDNMLWGGAVADKSEQDVSTVALRELNRELTLDSRVDCSLVPVGDGLMLARVL